MDTAAHSDDEDDLGRVAPPLARIPVTPPPWRRRSERT